MCLLIHPKIGGFVLDKIIYNMYLFVFHCIQNKVYVLLSTWFIKIGDKLMEI